MLLLQVEITKLKLDKDRKKALDRKKQQKEAEKGKHKQEDIKPMETSWTGSLLSCGKTMIDHLCIYYLCRCGYMTVICVVAFVTDDFQISVTKKIIINLRGL